MASWKGPNPFKHPKSSNRRYSWVDRTGNAHENQRFKLREVTQLIQHATYLHPGKISIKMLNSIRNELERTEFCLKLQSSREKFFPRSGWIGNGRLVLDNTLWNDGKWRSVSSPEGSGAGRLECLLIRRNKGEQVRTHKPRKPAMKRIGRTQPSKQRHERGP